jgi:hypothetical protein
MIRMKRRDFIVSSSLALGFSQRTAFGADAVVDETVEEQQKGDPEARYEFIQYNPSAIRAMATREPNGRATFQKWDKELPQKLITVSERFLGSSRDTTPDQISEFLELFGLPFETERGPLAFCAAGLSYCALSAFIPPPEDPAAPAPQKAQRLHQFKQLMPDIDHYYFYPTVSCLDMFHIAAGRRRWISHKQKPKTQPKPGWVVLFDWSDSGNADHCGIVTGATDKVVSTIEFNTSGTAGGSQRDGGTVSRKERSYKHTLGFIVTDQTPHKV